MPRSSRNQSESASPDTSIGATGSQTAAVRVTRSQATRLQTASAVKDPEPVTINWLFFDKSRPPACFAITIPHTLFNNQPSQNCEHIFSQELQNRHDFRAVLYNTQFWKPKGQIPVDMFDEREWPETFTKAENIAKMIQGATYFGDVFQGDLDRKMVHVIVTAKRVDEGRSDEERDEITSLPEIIHFCKNINYTSPAPSQGAKSLNYMDIQRQSDGAIYDGRHPHDGKPTTASPIHIFHPIFEAFIRRLHRPAQVPACRYLKMVRKIMDQMTQIRRPEWKRGRDFRNALKEVLNHTPILEANDDDTRTDGNIVIEVAGFRIPICMIEIKVEAGEGGCDPSTQAALSVRHFWVTQENFFPIRDKTCCPTILLAGSGAWLTILGAVFTDRPIVQRLTDMLWMGNSTTHREDRLLHLAHVFLALRDSIQDLSDYYTAVATDQNMQAFNKDSNDPHPRFFPYVTSVDCPEVGLIQFKYLRRLEDDATCVTFLAQLLDGSGKEIVVKFVTAYGAKVHKMLHEKRYAPALLYYGPIPTAGTVLNTIPLPSDQGAQFRRLLPLMSMVVMEYKKPGAWPASREDAKRQLRDALGYLHGNGYVFGDLRKPNVLFTEDGRLSLIDFDWAGAYKRGRPEVLGEPLVDQDYAHYPAGLSCNVNWASGVDDFAAIRPEHDNDMMIKLLDNEYPQQ